MESNKKSSSSKVPQQSSPCPLPYLTSQMALGVSLMALKDTTSRNNQQYVIESDNKAQYEPYQSLSKNSDEESQVLNNQLSELSSEMLSMVERLSFLEEKIKNQSRNSR